MQLRHPLLSLLSLLLLSAPFTAFSQTDSTRAILLTPIMGEVSPQQPQKVRLEITQGAAKGCQVEGTAHLNKRRMRYEFNLNPAHCVKNGKTIPVGHVVRGQHNIKGTMANSGMGRDYLVSRKGVEVTLADR
jgi:hypothetical protein